jgi:hypothetical protein
MSDHILASLTDKERIVYQSAQIAVRAANENLYNLDRIALKRRAKALLRVLMIQKTKHGLLAFEIRSLKNGPHGLSMRLFGDTVDVAFNASLHNYVDDWNYERASKRDIARIRRVINGLVKKIV